MVVLEGASPGSALGVWTAAVASRPSSGAQSRVDVGAPSGVQIHFKALRVETLARASAGQRGARLAAAGGGAPARPPARPPAQITASIFCAAKQSAASDGRPARQRAPARPAPITARARGAPAAMSHLYRHTKLGIALDQSLDRLVSEGRVPGPLALEVLGQVRARPAPPAAAAVRAPRLRVCTLPPPKNPHDSKPATPPAPAVRRRDGARARAPRGRQGDAPRPP